MSKNTYRPRYSERIGAFLRDHAKDGSIEHDTGGIGVEDTRFDDLTRADGGGEGCFVDHGVARTFGARQGNTGDLGAKCRVRENGFGVVFTDCHVGRLADVFLGELGSDQLPTGLHDEVVDFSVQFEVAVSVVEIEGHVTLELNGFIVCFHSFSLCVLGELDDRRARESLPCQPFVGRP